MNEATRLRLFSPADALDAPGTALLGLLFLGALVVARVLLTRHRRQGRLSGDVQIELDARWATWAWIVGGLLVSLTLGAAIFMAATFVLSLLCLREYSRQTGLFRERAVGLVLVLGVGLLALACLDHWLGFFMALIPLGVLLIVAVAVLADRPEGYLQRVALGVLGFLLFGTGLAHLAYLGNDVGYRPIVLWIFLGTAVGDIAAYVVGKRWGRRPLAPRTSPHKTRAGAIGALLLSPLITVGVGRVVFQGTPMASWPVLAGAGVLLALTGLLGDLVLSSIKRDLGIKDMGAALPGHGGWLDRFDSLVLAAPALFHYVHHVRGIGIDTPSRILTG